MTKPPPRPAPSPPSTPAQASLYQTLRHTSTVLKLDACAEAFPRVLDEAARRATDGHRDARAAARDRGRHRPRPPTRRPAPLRVPADTGDVG